MQENIPLTIEKFTGEQEKEYRITSARQIQSLLHGIVESGAPAALYFDGTRDFIITSLLGVGAEGLWVGQSSEMPKNQRIAESRGITLVSLIDQVKIQFAADGAKAVTHQDYPAFYLPLPGSLYRVQRREYYRIAIPLSEQLRCIIPINQSQEGGQLEAAVLDISGGGLRLSCAKEDIGFVVGQTYTGCQIDLPDVGKISVAMTVKSLVSISPQPGQTALQVGCEFKNLNNASNILLQRYVTMMQRLKNVNNDT